MTQLDSMKDIESAEFAIRVGLANSFRAFWRNISSEASVQNLLTLSRSEASARQLLQKIVSLSDLRVDFRYLHPFDISLATYLWILLRTFPQYARAGAEATAYLPQTWWTSQVCRYVLGEWSQKPPTLTSADDRLFAEDSPSISTSNATTSASLVFLESPRGVTPSKEVVRLNSNQTSSDAREVFVLEQEDGGEKPAAPTFTTYTPSGLPVKPE